MDESKKRELKFRIIAAVVLVPIVVALIMYLPKPLFFIAILAINLGIVAEFIKIAQCERDKARCTLTWVGAIIIPFAFYFKSFPLIISLLFFIMLVTFLVKMLTDTPTDNVLNDVASSFFSIIFIPFLFSFILLVHDISPVWLLCILCIVWGADSFAYFFGISFGKHKLIPKVSPAKSVEGLIGGFIGALLIALLFNYLFIDIHPLLMAIVAVEVIVASVIGDLIESMLKRSASIKDSGHVIPGHGGLFDRADSVLFAVPAAYFYLEFVVLRFYP